MNILTRFNRFFHGAILKDLFDKSQSIVFKELVDTRTNEYFKIIKYDDYSDLDDLKQLLKLLNLDYKVDEEKDKKISTTEIEVKELLNHVEWVFKIASDNGIELKVVKEEWDRIVLQYNR